MYTLTHTHHCAALLQRRPDHAVRYVWFGDVQTVHLDPDKVRQRSVRALRLETRDHLFHDRRLAHARQTADVDRTAGALRLDRVPQRAVDLAALGLATRHDPRQTRQLQLLARAL